MNNAVSTAAALANIVIALGTLVTVIVAVATLRSQVAERSLDHVRNVRTWMEWVTTKEVEDRPDWDEWAPRGTISNRTDAPIYNLRYRLFLGGLDRRTGVDSALLLLPGMDLSLQSHRSFDYQTVDRIHSLTSWRAGLEIAFTDSNGRRWLRDGRGKLSRLKPLRWFAPLRNVHHVEYGISPLPWWALRATWIYRQDIATGRDIISAPPPFIAVDIRWKRWRAASKESPVTLPWWDVRARLREADQICSEREEGQFPLPFWALKQRAAYARKWKRKLRNMNTAIYR